MPHAKLPDVELDRYGGAATTVCRMKQHLRAVVGQSLVALACLLWLAACSNQSNLAVGSITPDNAADPSQKALDAKSPVKIAMLLPLSGSPQTAAIAKGLQQAAELALFELNAPSLQLLVKDDKGTEEGARAAAEDAVKGGAELIIGPLFAKSVTAAAPLARQAKVPMIAFSNDARVASAGVYLLSFLPAQEVPRIVAFTASQGRQRFAALVPDDAAGRVLEPLFKAAVERGGGTVVAMERFPVDVSGMIDPVRRLREAMQTAEAAGEPIEALFLPGGQDTLPIIGPMLPKSEIDPQRIKMIGVGGWDYPNAGRERILEGGWFAAPDPRGWRDFSERFAKTYKTMPPRLASLAYDAVGVGAAFAGAAQGARYTPDNLLRAAGFTGIDGPFRFQPGGLSERGLAILEVQKFGPTVLDPAPGSPTASQAQAEVGGRRLN
jgi:branched-chain amino acid transport system substrate-binding protein